MGDSKRLLALYAKETAGTLTPDETAELEAHVRDWASKQYDTCPVCGGAFPESLAFNQPFDCPNCGTSLTNFASDIVPHLPHEIDPSTLESRFLGEFCVVYIPRGCKGCFCGEIFPQSYSCCPGVLVLAIALSQNGTETQQTAAINFLDKHKETLINCLRGRFVQLFDERSIRQLAALCDVLSFGEAKNGS